MQPTPEDLPEWKRTALQIEWMAAQWFLDAPDKPSTPPPNWANIDLESFLWGLEGALRRIGPGSEAEGVDGWNTMRGALALAINEQGPTSQQFLENSIRARLAVLRRVAAAAPPAPEINDDDEIVEVWWRRTRMLRCDPPDLFGAWDLWWAQDHIEQRALYDDEEGIVVLLDRLIDVPDVDLCAFACCGPLQDVLADRGAEVQERMAEYCQRYEPWRKAVGMIDLDAKQAAAVPALAEWLP